MVMWSSLGLSLCRLWSMGDNCDSRCEYILAFVDYNGILGELSERTSMNY